VASATSAVLEPPPVSAASELALAISTSTSLSFDVRVAWPLPTWLMLVPRGEIILIGRESLLLLLLLFGGGMARRSSSIAFLLPPSCSGSTLGVDILEVSDPLRLEWP